LPLVLLVVGVKPSSVQSVFSAVADSRFL